MTEQEFQQWIRDHGGERGREAAYITKQVDVREDPRDPPKWESRRERAGDKITARDGAVIVVHRAPTSGQPGQPDYEVIDRMDPEPKTVTQQTPEQIRSATATAQQNEYENEEKIRENNERSWNQQNSPARLPETHLERATREAKEKADRDAEARRVEERRKADELRADDIAERGRNRVSEENIAAENRAVTREQLEETKRQNEYTRNKPDFLTPDSKNPFITRYDPASGQIVSADNPNFDAVKAAAEEERARITSQIQQRQMSLEEGKQAYTQWFDSNVRVPLMQSQEVRARAEEQRQALEAEERRRQFAADYKLRKATLGEQASQRATSAEISLLPYRSGPTWGEDFSSAVNSLAAGGRMDTNASAGINFRDSSFAFARPDFKQIAKDAAKAVLSGLTDYRPSDSDFATGDYSGIPQVNMGGMPAIPSYSYGATPMPAPSAGYELPPE